MTNNPYEKAFEDELEETRFVITKPKPEIVIRISGEIEEVESVDIYFKDRRENKNND